MIRLMIVTMVAVGCAACGGSDSPDAGESESAPEVGQCRNTPASNLGDEDWFDDSPVVDCSKTHTLQTLKVIDTDQKVTREVVEQLAKYCEAESAGFYVGSPGPGPYNIVWPIAYGPTPEQTEAGQSWVRCDAGIHAKTRCCLPLLPQTASMEGAMATNLARFQQCLGEVPDLDRNQALTSCEEPHRAELLPVFMELDTKEYPSPAKLRKSGQSVCADLVADREDAASLVMTIWWQPKNEWQPGTLYGGCWIHRKDGELLPAA